MLMIVMMGEDDDKSNAHINSSFFFSARLKCSPSVIIAGSAKVNLER
jgi:hypothetical protein